MNPDTYHLPDLGSFDGVVDLLSLCNLMELSNILFPAKNLMHPTLREQFIQARLLCRKMVDWMGCNLEFHTQDGKYLDFQTNVCAFYLARQAKALVASKASLAKEGDVDPLAVESAVRDCFSENTQFNQQWNAIQDWTPDTLALELPQGTGGVTVIRRTVPLDQSGETYSLGLNYLIANGLPIFIVRFDHRGDK